MLIITYVIRGFGMEEIKKIEVFYTNADCLSQSKKEELELVIKDSAPDILGITEVFPKRSFFVIQETFYY